MRARTGKYSDLPICVEEFVVRCTEMQTCVRHLVGHAASASARRAHAGIPKTEMQAGCLYLYLREEVVQP